MIITYNGIEIIDKELSGLELLEKAEAQRKADYIIGEYKKQCRRKRRKIKVFNPIKYFDITFDDIFSFKNAAIGAIVVLMMYL